MSPILTSCVPPFSSALGISLIFLPATPTSGFPTLESWPPTPFVGPRRKARSRVENLGLPTCFRAQTGPASQSEITYEFPARKICAIKGMTLETDDQPFLNGWFDRTF